MSRITDLSDRALEQALELIHQAGTGLRTAGSSIKDVGSNAGHLLQTGAALGAVKTGTRVAGKFARRNPAALAAVAAAGAGLLAYAVYRKRKKAQDGAIEGNSQRLEARRERSNAAHRARAAKASKVAVTPTDEG
ncbi:MAG: hypothetical protein ABW178_03200 [Pseudoxanthomonas sp.]